MIGDEDLLDAERELHRSIATGAVIDRLRGDVATGATWDETRTVRARVLIRALSVVEGGGAGQRPQAARLRGVRIVERLDLTGRELLCPLELDHCFLDDEISFDEARATSLKLLACHVPKGLTAYALTTQGDLALRGLVSTRLRLKNAHIGGQLDLTGATLTRSSGHAFDADGLRVDRSMICTRLAVQGEVYMSRAQIGGLLNFDAATLINPSGDALRADRLRVEHGLFCRWGFSTTGKVRLPRAYVGGQLSFRGATLSNPSKPALYAHGLRVDQNMVCSDGFSAEGEVQLLGAHIGGQLDFAGATLAGCAGPALSADRLRVDQDMFCCGQFTARGEVSLHGARIGGQLDFSGATLVANPDRPALSAGGLQIDQSMFCARYRVPRATRVPRERTRRRPQTTESGKRFEATGEVNLSGARIGGQLDFSSAQLENSYGPTLSADRLHVDQEMFCREQFTACGEVSLDGARIGGLLDFSGATLIGNSDRPVLSAEGLQVDQGMFCEERDGVTFTVSGEVCLPRALIGGQLVWLPQHGHTGHLSLYRARVGSLVDSEESWPPSGRLEIEHFVYDGFGQDAPARAKDRIRWLELELGFKSQPYQQLIRVYRAHGQDADARRVAIARERARRKRGKPGTLGWLRSVVLGATIRYGYAPALAAAWLVGVYVLGVVIFGIAADRGSFIAVRAPRPSAEATALATTFAANPTPSASECRQEDRYPCFDRWAYGVDVVVPLINLHQADYWQPDVSKPYGDWARLYGWIATPLGWALTTLAVAGITGLVRRD